MSFLAFPVNGEDMRVASQKAKADYEAALREAKASEERIFKERASLEKEIARMEADIKNSNLTFRSCKMSLKT